MIHSIRFKLIISLLIVSFMVGGVSLFIGHKLLQNTITHEAITHSRLALKATHDVYNAHINFIHTALDITTLGSGFQSSVINKNIPDLAFRINQLAANAQLDFAGIMTHEGVLLCRLNPHSNPDKISLQENPLVRQTIYQKRMTAGTIVFSREVMILENPELAERLKNPPVNGRNTCLAVGAAIPIFEGQRGENLTGVIYGGRLLHQSTNILDSIPKFFFFDHIQSASNEMAFRIFFHNISIATNIIDGNGIRSIGKKAPDEAEQKVLIMGNQWTTRQHDSTGWNLVAFDPISDIAGEKVGMLSISISEAHYVSAQNRFILYLSLAILASVVIALLMGIVLTQRIMRPVHRLIKASQQVSDGNVSPDIGPMSKDKEMAVLQATFKKMVESMKRRRMESQTKIIQSEKQASIGQLAAGVGHEINNPLTGVLTYTHMLLRRKDIPEDIRSDLNVIAESTERVRKIVKGLLDFSRQTRLDPEPIDINRLATTTIKLMENQALLKGVLVQFNPGKDIPVMVIDRSKIESVLLNILINALDATRPGDTITVQTTTAVSTMDVSHMGVEIVITDTGSGIPPENLNKLFDPFFSTKEVGKGTGLGLSVSYGIVKEHGGTIRVQSEMGKGSAFFI
ncbi:MAG: ATP-binding protein, partial [Desulfobacula sp.]